MNQMRQDYLASRLCSAGYHDTKARTDCLLIDYIHAFGENHDWEVMVGEGVENNFAVFRGCEAGATVSWVDALKALLLSHRGNPYGLHKDFYNAWEEVSPAVYKAVQTVHYTQTQETGKPKPWVFTGHGIGGSLAAIGAAAFKPATLVTFGAPRTGNKTFAAAVDDACNWRRWDDASDWGSMFPLAGKQMHGGDLYRIRTNGKLDINPPISDQVLDHGKWFERHDIENYVDYLEESFYGTTH